MIISDSKRDAIRETAREIIDARSDDEFNEACAAMAHLIAEADCAPGFAARKVPA